MYTQGKRFLAVLGLAGALLGVGAVARVGWADWVRRDNTEGQVRVAIGLVPLNWNYYRDLAELEGMSAPKKVAALRRAVGLNEGNPWLRMELGGAEEGVRDFHAAEGSLRRAVELDTTYAPRAELAAFYFRRKDSGKFLEAARGALALPLPGGVKQDLGVLFGECWELVEDGAEIRRVVMPENAEDWLGYIWRSYLDFLMGSGRWAEARVAAARVMRGSVAEGKDVVLRYCEGMLGQGDGVEAAKAWKWSGSKEMGLGSTSSQKGFDWRYAGGGGLYFEVSGNGLKVGFSGKQAERCDVLWRYVVLEGGRRYRLKAVVKTPWRGPGLRWEVVAGGKDLLGGGETFDGIAGLARLVLRYERAVGTVRVEGDVMVGQAVIE